MKCSEIESRLSAHLDGELSSSDQRLVQAHLQSCPACSRALDDLRDVDGKLSALQPPADLAAKIQAKVAASNVGSSIELPQPKLSRWYAWGMVLSIAASIALIVLVPPSDPVIVTKPIAGQLIRATGGVQVLASGSQFWKSIPASQSIPVLEGSRLRTADKVMCEIETSQQGRIRVNEKAELIIHQSDRVELVQGQIWCRAPDDGQLIIETPASAMDVDGGPWTMTCPRASEFQWSVDGQLTVCNSLADQEVQWNLGSISHTVPPGETVSVDSQKNIQRSQQLAASVKIWQLPLLAIETEGNGELSSVLQPLLAQIGRTKAQHLHEQQIRALGPAGAIPLLAYVISDDSRQQPSLRRTAIGIAAATSDRSAMTFLQQLTSDADPYVSAAADRAIKRLGEVK